MYNILDHGAMADSLSTAAIQAAIDACAGDGGGTVLIPNGTFIIGTIWLRSNVELHLEAGAVLKASENMDDYNDEDAYPQNYGVPSENWKGKHLIIAHECDNVALTGHGVIDGSGDFYYGTERFFENPYCWLGGYVTARDKEKLRPGQCACFIESTNVRVTDVTFRNMTCWALFLHGCEVAEVQRITVKNPFDHVNTDGIDVDCSRFVTVSDCVISTGDDAIAIRCDSEKLKNPKPCENVTVTNCVLASNSSVFRLGVGKGEIRHVRISNLAISRAGNMVTCSTSWGDWGKAEIEDVSFTNITADNTLRVFQCAVTHGSVKNLEIKNLRANAKCGFLITSKSEDAVVSDLTFKNVDLTVYEKQVPDEKYLIDISNVKNVTLSEVKVAAVKEDWAEVYHSENNENINTVNCNF